MITFVLCILASVIVAVLSERRWQREIAVIQERHKTELNSLRIECSEIWREEFRETIQRFAQESDRLCNLAADAQKEVTTFSMIVGERDDRVLVVRYADGTPAGLYPGEFINDASMN